MLLWFLGTHSGSSLSVLPHSTMLMYLVSLSLFTCTSGLLGCPDKGPQTPGAVTTQMYVLPVLEARVWDQGLAGLVSSEASLLRVGMPVSSLSPHAVFLPYVSVF